MQQGEDVHVDVPWMHPTNHSQPDIGIISPEAAKSSSILMDNKELQTLIGSVISDDNLVTEIFMYVPVKTLQEVKYVSRRWHSLLTDKSLCIRKSKRIEKPSGVFYCSRLLAYNFEPLDLENGVAASLLQKIKIEGVPSCIGNSCNGLMIIHGFALHIKNHQGFIYVYNPTTNQFRSIPDPTYMNNPRSVPICVNLAYNPTKTPSYKIICAHQFYDHNLNRIGVYSSDTQLWNCVLGPCTPTHDNVEHAAFWRGAIWYVPGNVPGNPVPDESFYLQVEEEKLHTYLMPRSPTSYQILYFGELNDHLNLILTNGGPTSQFNIYEMEEDFPSWFVKYSVDLDPVLDEYPGTYKKPDPPAGFDPPFYGLQYLARERNEEDDFIVLRVWGEVIRYSIAKKSYIKFCDVTPVDWRPPWPMVEWIEVFVYIRSLAPV